MILVIIQWSEWADWLDAMVEGDMENTGVMPNSSQTGLDLWKGGCHPFFYMWKTDRNPETITMDEIQQQEKEDCKCHTLF